MQSTSFRVIEHTNKGRYRSMNSENKIYQIPEFTGENIPVTVAAKIMKKDQQFIRWGMAQGILPIGIAMKKKVPIIMTIT